MSKPLRILHIITGLQVGGAEMALYRLLLSLDRENFQSEVISLTGDQPIGEKIREIGIPVTALGLRSGSFNPSLVWRLTGIIRREKPDIIQTWMYHSDLAGGLAATLAGSPPVIWNIRHSLTSKADLKPRTYLVAKLCALSSHSLPRKIICNAELGRSSHIALGYNAAKMLVIPNGFDTSQFKRDPLARASVEAELGLPAGTLLVGLSARYNPLKDHAGFLHAAALLSRQFIGIHFILWGQGVDGDNATLTALAEELGISAQVHMLGLRMDAPRLFAALDVAALSSFSEGFPQVIGEAMACGVPCAVTDAGDAAFVVGETGRVVPPRNPQALAGAIGEIISLPAEERAALGRAARERVQTLFSLEKTTEKYAQTYRQVIAYGEKT